MLYFFIFAEDLKIFDENIFKNNSQSAICGACHLYHFSVLGVANGQVINALHRPNRTFGGIYTHSQ